MTTNFSCSKGLRASPRGRPRRLALLVLLGLTTLFGALAAGAAPPQAAPSDGGIEAVTAVRMMPMALVSRAHATVQGPHGEAVSFALFGLSLIGVSAGLRTVRARRQRDRQPKPAERVVRGLAVDASRGVTMAR